MGTILKSIAGFAALALAYMALAGCASGSQAAQGAARGATTGGLASAVGAAATALIFGGDVGEAAARGAVYGGTAGAVAGGMAGASADRRAAEAERAEHDRRVAAFRSEIGDDAFNGVVALARCKHEIAAANAREAQRSSNGDFSLAGFWVEALTAADQGDEDGAAALLPVIADIDRNYDSGDAVRVRLDEGLKELTAIRTRYDLPAVCE